MSEDYTCAWCGAACMDRGDYHRHVAESECDVSSLRAVINELRAQIEQSANIAELSDDAGDL